MVIAEALRTLEVDTLLLGIPDRCLPAAPDEDTGAGALDTREGRRFAAWVRALGFTGIQLGPQGETALANPSPYDGTIFSRGRIGLAVTRLADPDWGGLLDAGTVERLVAGRPPGDPERIAYGYAYTANGEALAHAHAAFAARQAASDRALSPIAARLETFTRQAWEWLERDALYEALAGAAGGAPWTAWPEAIDRTLWHPTSAEAAHAVRRRALCERHASVVGRYAFAQWVL